MPAFTPVVINDGKTTPLSHTFDLTSNGAGRAVLHNRAALTLVSQENLVVEVKQPAGKNGAYRATVSLGVPVALTDVNGRVSVDHLSSAKVEFNFAQSSSLAERKDVVALFANALNNAMVKECILEVEPIYT